MRQVIHIYGPSGGGISTLGKYLCEKLGYFWMDTDDYFWAPTNPPFTTKRPVAERIALIAENCEKYGNVVISGSLTDWGDALIPHFTLAVRVETELQVRMARLEARERARFGSRLDPGGDMYENHRAFMEWAAAYDTAGVEQRSMAKHDEWEKLLKCPILRLDGAKPVEENFRFVYDALRGGEEI